MVNQNFQVKERFRNFVNRLRSKPEDGKRLWLYAVIWFAVTPLMLFPGGVHVAIVIPGVVLFFISWLKFSKQVIGHYTPPVELLIGLFYLIFILERGLLQSVYPGPAQGADPGIAASVLHVVLLTLLIMVFSFILVRNNKGKVSILIWYWLISVIAVSVLEGTGIVREFIVQIILFTLLLRQTSWLEELTKVECWIYLIASYILFRGFSDLSPFAGVEAGAFGDTEAWIAMPKFMYFLFKMYLLALVVKIPVVLIYNFASLSRKMRISGLFQSTFPQFIQLVMLLLIFYFFIAGWQAERVHHALTSHLEELTARPGAYPERVISAPVEEGDYTLALQGYEPVQVTDGYPENGVMRIPREDDSEGEQVGDPFIFFRSEQDDIDTIHFVRLNDDFLRSVAAQSDILIGSNLIAYDYEVKQWETYLYNLIFWNDEETFTVFPFGFRPVIDADAISVSFQEEESDEDWLDEQWGGAGRVITPSLNSELKQSGFYAFEIIVLPSFELLTPTLLRYITLLVVIYLLLNLVVIRRMARFGSEINKTIVEKFGQLKNGIREISTGNLDHKVKLEGQDEFVELAQHFNQMGERLKESIEEAREKERLAQELKIARQVQLDLLPQHLPEIPGYDLNAIMQTANEVGGDFYDVLRLDDDRSMFTVGDVSGKGTSAAFYMAQCISLIRYSPQFTDQPDEIALRLNHYFADTHIDRQIFVTAVIGTLDSRSGKLSFVRAGHNPPIFIPNQKTEQIRELTPNGLGIGLKRDGEEFEATLETETVSLKPGESILFYTDGLVEASFSNGSPKQGNEQDKEFYGEERLRELLKSMRGEKAAHIFQALQRDIESFYNGHLPVDDYTLLIIQRSHP